MRNLLLLIYFLSIHTTGSAQPGQWTWLHGSQTSGSAGSYGVQGIPAPANEPPAVYEPMEWTDQSGKFWMYGGRSATGNFFNALWKYDPGTNEWTWINGLNTPNDPGNYGIQGVSSPLNRPPARGWSAATWVDLNNNLWVFGGEVGSFNGYSDLWMYDMGTNEWTWMKGPGTTGVPGTYGTQGVPGPLNNPGGRWESAGSWTDNAGNLWLFGGYNSSMWNDLWRYHIATNEWTWMKGSQVGNDIGWSGTLGVEDPANNPSARASHSRWKDLNGNLWLFGGDIFNQQDDMWRYNPSTNNWTWMSGTNQPFPTRLYGTRCVSSPSNTPGGRVENRACWTGQNGNFWFFGGNSNDLFNDLWLYCTTTNEWTWVSGDTIPGASGNWGSLGVSSPLNKPDARAGSVAWTDINGSLYFFGGSAIPFASSSMNDLWKFEIDLTCGVCNVSPSAIFTAPNHICPGTCTDFTNLSANATSFLWSFTGANPSTSTDVAPTNICYNSPGTYAVSLIASNTAGSDTLTLNNFMTVYPYPAPQGILQSGDTLFANPGAVSYQWYHDGNIISGATTYFYVATEGGNYNVVATDNNNCEVEAALFDVVAGLQTTIEKSQLVIFPNPVNNSLTIQNFNSHFNKFAIKSISIYNMMGQKVIDAELHDTRSSFPVDVEVSALTNGMYWLEISGGVKTNRLKFIKYSSQ